MAAARSPHDALRALRDASPYSAHSSYTGSLPGSPTTSYSRFTGDSLSYGTGSHVPSRATASSRRSAPPTPILAVPPTAAVGVRMSDTASLASSVVSRTSSVFKPLMNHAVALAEKDTRFASVFAVIVEALDKNREDRRYFRRLLRTMQAHVNGVFAEGERPIACWDADDVALTQSQLHELRCERDAVYKELEEQVSLRSTDYEKVKYIVQQRAAALGAAEEAQRLVSRYPRWGGPMQTTYRSMKTKLESIERNLEASMAHLPTRLAALHAMNERGSKGEQASTASAP